VTGGLRRVETRRFGTEHAIGADGGRRADEAEDARDGTGPPLRDALDARWRRRRKVRARERGVI